MFKSNEVAGALLNLPKHKLVRYNQPSESLICPSLVIGLEVEVEQGYAVAQRHVDAPIPQQHAQGAMAQVHRTADGAIIPHGARLRVGNEYWQAVVDGSVRNDGIELISDPLFGRDLIAACRELEEIFAYTDARITDTCGLHVHVDSRDMSLTHLLSFLLVYICVEEILFKYAGPERRSLFYCMSLSDSLALRNFFSDMFDGRVFAGGARQFQAFIKKYCKYSALNLAPLQKYGTVEFRMHAGTLEADKLIEWINIIMCIYRYASRIDPDTLLEDVSNSGFVPILSGEIFPEYYEILRYPGIESDFLRGIRTAQSCLYYHKMAATEELFLFHLAQKAAREIGDTPPTKGPKKLAALKAKRLPKKGCTRIPIDQWHRTICMLANPDNIIRRNNEDRLNEDRLITVTEELEMGRWVTANATTPTITYRTVGPMELPRNGPPLPPPPTEEGADLGPWNLQRPVAVAISNLRMFFDDHEVTDDDFTFDACLEHIVRTLRGRNQNATLMEQEITMVKTALRPILGIALTNTFMNHASIFLQDSYLAAQTYHKLFRTILPELILALNLDMTTHSRAAHMAVTEIVNLRQRLLIENELRRDVDRIAGRFINDYMGEEPDRYED